VKRILASLVLAGFIVAVTVGCGGDTKPTPPKTTPPAGGPKMDAKGGGAPAPEKK
jgi:hypothetical protein